jgi:hypothetical protein
VAQKVIQSEISVELVIKIVEAEDLLKSKNKIQSVKKNRQSILA